MSHAKLLSGYKKCLSSSAAASRLISFSVSYSFAIADFVFVLPSTKFCFIVCDLACHMLQLLSSLAISKSFSHCRFWAMAAILFRIDLFIMKSITVKNKNVCSMHRCYIEFIYCACVFFLNIASGVLLWITGSDWPKVHPGVLYRASLCLLMILYWCHLIPFWKYQVIEIDEYQSFIF